MSNKSGEGGEFESASDPLEESFQFKEAEWVAAKIPKKPVPGSKTEPVKLDDFGGVEAEPIAEVVKHWEAIKQYSHT